MRGSDRVPARASWSLAALPGLARNLMLLRVDRHGHFKYMFTGSEVVSIHGADMAGRPMTDIWPQQLLDIVAPLARQCAAYPCGMLTSIRADQEDGCAPIFSGLLLPVEGDLKSCLYFLALPIEGDGIRPGDTMFTVMSTPSVVTLAPVDLGQGAPFQVRTIHFPALA